jgi:hypothetical protein
VPKTIDIHSEMQELASEIDHKDNESEDTFSPFMQDNNQQEIKNNNGDQTNV